jgi:hypothetical protein
MTSQKRFDFDPQTQEVFDYKFSNLSKVNWREWLHIKNSEDYKELTLKLSGMDNVDDVWQRLKTSITDSKDLSVDLKSYIQTRDQSPLIMCHTSGTTNNDLNALKWFHMTDDIVKNLWAPGMQAIFESSGLNTKNSALIFVPSRLKCDGINQSDGKKYLSLYSPEFSQRVMLSVINPKSYLFYEYKDVFNLSVLNKIFLMDEIAILSAPAATILKWADKERLKQGINHFINKENSQNNNHELEPWLTELKTEGLDTYVNKLHKKLSEKLKDAATLVFSISSLSSKKWNLIRDFMGWKKGNEKFTSLYVGSEIGPFASNLSVIEKERLQKDEMFVFPLTLPVIQYKSQKDFILNTKSDKGRLFVSYKKEGKPLVNINVGDFIFIENKEGIPTINGTILRDNFEIKYQIKPSSFVSKENNVKFYAGDYFNLESFEVIEPRKLLNCISKRCNYNADTMLLVSKNKNSSWILYLENSTNFKCENDDSLTKIIQNCNIKPSFKNFLLSDNITFKFINDSLVDFEEKRSNMLEKVRKGNIPKGVLKKWPLYIIK